MVSFIDFYFHFLANFQTQTSPHVFSIFKHVMKSERDTNSEPGLPLMKARPSFAQQIIALTTL